MHSLKCTSYFTSTSQEEEEEDDDVKPKTLGTLLLPYTVTVRRRIVSFSNFQTAVLLFFFSCNSISSCMMPPPSPLPILILMKMVIINLFMKKVFLLIYAQTMVGNQPPSLAATASETFTTITIPTTDCHPVLLLRSLRSIIIIITIIPPTCLSSFNKNK